MKKKQFYISCSLYRSLCITSSFILTCYDILIRFRLTLSELIDSLEEDDIQSGNIYITPPKDGVDTDIDSDLSDDEHDGNICHLGPAMLRVESEFVPIQHEDTGIPVQGYDSDDDIPLATLFPNAAANFLPESSRPSSSKRRKMNTWTNAEPSFDIQRNCTNRNPPDEVYEKKTPLEFFQLFFDEEVLTNILEQSNLYAQQKNYNLKLTKNELLVVFGGLLLSGYGKYPNKRMYWSNENDVPSILSESMRLNRFETILRHIHLNDNSRIDDRDKLYKLKPLIDKLNINFRINGGLNENISIDESMIPYYGKHFAKQYIKGKPIRFGFKNWALCTSNGYMVSFDIYTGKNRTNDSNKTTDFGLGGSVVLNLIEISQIPPNSGYKIFIDNYFTSLKLLNHLSTLGYCSTGTVRDNRLEDCPLRNQQKQLAKEKRGTHQFSSSDNVVVFLWKDNKVVSAASNFENCEMKTTSRYCRESRSKIMVPQPKIFDSYNKGMGGVDKMDGLVAVYRSRMRQRKWWWPIFSYLFDVSVVNSWLLFRKVHPSHEMSSGLLKFRRYLALSLLKSYGQKSNKGKITPAPVHDVRYDKVSHLPEYSENERRCIQCGKNAKFVCIKCKRALHPKFCFLKYHTQ